MSKYFYVFFVLSLVVFGCRFPNPKANFRGALNAVVGENINSMQSYDPGYKDLLVESKRLENGNFENKYLWKHPLGECLYIFEIDGKTNRILFWKIEGDDSGCLLNP